MKLKILTVMAAAILWWVQRGQAKATQPRNSKTARTDRSDKGETGIR